MPKYLLMLFAFVWGCAANQAIFLTENSVVDGMPIQPGEALNRATPHLSAHGTVVWKQEENLQTHIIRKGRYYFIKRSDFPAKSINWYLNTCVRVDAKTGEIAFLD